MYGKHFASTYTGSMVGSGVHVFAVWGYVISHSVKSRVELNSVLLSAILGCEETKITEAIEKLCSPDPKSRNKDHEGRRLIKEGEYQYFVTGHGKYRSILNEDERREYNRIKQAEHRKSVKEHVIDMSALSAHTEADTDTDKDKEGACKPLALFLQGCKDKDKGIVKGEKDIGKPVVYDSEGEEYQQFKKDYETKNGIKLS